MKWWRGRGPGQTIVGPGPGRTPNPVPPNEGQRLLDEPLPWAGVYIGDVRIAEVCPRCCSLVAPGEGFNTGLQRMRSNREHHMETMHP